MTETLATLLRAQSKRIEDAAFGFEAAVMGGDTGAASERWNELQKALKGTKPKRPAYAEPKDLEHDHPMEGLTPADHARHIRHHEDEYSRLQTQHAHETDPAKRQVITTAMRSTAKHWHDHRLHKDAPPLDPKDRVLKDKHFKEALGGGGGLSGLHGHFNPDEARASDGKWTDGGGGNSPKTGGGAVTAVTPSPSGKTEKAPGKPESDQTGGREADRSLSDGGDADSLESRFAKSMDPAAAKALAEKVGRKGKGEGRPVELDQKELQAVLKDGRFGLVSAGPNPRFEEDKNLGPEDLEKRNKQMQDELVQAGFAFTRVKGHYDGEEDSFLVMVHDHDRDHLVELGKKFHQDSVIYADRGKQEMEYTTGEHAKKGECEAGEGVEDASGSDNYFTEFSHPDGKKTKFSLKFNFGKFVPCSKALEDLLKALGLERHAYVPGPDGECDKRYLIDGEVTTCGEPEGAHVAKALRQAGQTVDFAGFRVFIENPTDSVRRGTGPQGPWESSLRADYGEILGTKGVDGDEVDCFLGDDPTAPFAYVIHQHDIGKVAAWPGGCCPKCGEVPWNCPHDFDEDKVMLGYRSEEEAVQAYLYNYDSDQFLGPVTQVPVVKLHEWLRSKRGEILKSVMEVVLFAKSLGLHNKHPLVHPTPDGSKVHVYTPGYHKPFVHALHALIPNPAEKQWNPSKTRWEIAGHHLHAVAALAHKFWDASKHPKDAHGHFLHTGKLLEKKTGSGTKHPLHDAIKQGLAVLSDNDPDHVGEKNDVGWNSNDTKYGHQLNGTPELTWGQAEAALKMLHKYKNTQIPHLADALYGEGAKAAMGDIADTMALKGMMTTPNGVTEKSGKGEVLTHVEDAVHEGLATKSNVKPEAQEKVKPKAADPMVTFGDPPFPDGPDPADYTGLGGSVNEHYGTYPPPVVGIDPGVPGATSGLPSAPPSVESAPAAASAPGAEKPKLPVVVALEELGGEAFVQAIAGKAGLKLGEANQQLLAAMHEGLVDLNGIGQWVLVKQSAVTFPEGFTPIGLDEWHKTKSPWHPKDTEKLALLPEKYKGWKAHILGMTPEQVEAHPYLNPWEKGFVKGNLGTPLSKLSFKQNNTVSNIQNTFKKWVLANPEVIPGLWDAVNQAGEKDAAAKKAEQYEKVAILSEQTNTELENPPGMNTDILINGELFAHQKAGVNWLKAAKRGIIALATGLGKTWTVITAFESLKSEGKANRMGFVVPKGRLVGTVKDIDQLFPGKKIVVISGSSLGTPQELDAHFKENTTVFIGDADKEAVWKAIEDADYVVCGYDPIRKHAAKFAGLCDVMAFDEAVRLKGKGSEISKQVREHFAGTKNIWYMSATPIPNNPTDLWVLMNGLAPKIFGTLADFKKNHCETKYVPKTGQSIITGYSNVAETRKECAHLIYHRDYDSPDVKVAMPPKSQEQEFLEMPSELAQVYKAAQEAILEKVLSAGAAKFNPKMILTELLRLEQISLSPRLLDPSYLGPEPKLERAAQLALDHFKEQTDKKPPKGIIFFSHFLGVHPLLSEHLAEEAGVLPHEVATIQGSDYRVGGKKVKTIQDVVDAVNTGKCKVLVASDAAMEGLNLQFGANKLVHLDTPWRPDALEQREGRIYRPGQQEHCHFTHLLLNNSIENKKDQVVKKKASEQSAIISGEGDVEEIVGFGYQDALQALGYVPIPKEEAK